MQHQAVLSWVASATPGAQYNVYAGPAIGAENLGAPLNGTTPVVGTSYTDLSVVPGQQRWYLVKAVDPVNGLESSGSSNEVAVTVPVPQPPANPGALSVVSFQ